MIAYEKCCPAVIILVMPTRPLALLQGKKAKSLLRAYRSFMGTIIGLRLSLASNIVGLLYTLMDIHTLHQYTTDEPV